MSEAFDAIVVGGGVMGTAAARELVTRGRSTLLLERFTFGHANGSSGGPTRIFRFTYEHPDYVRMAVAALDRWRDLERQAGRELLRTTGGLDVGPGAETATAALRAAGVPFHWLRAEEAAERWPGLLMDPGSRVLFQDDAGVLSAGAAVAALARLAAKAGAEIREYRLQDWVQPTAEWRTYCVVWEWPPFCTESGGRNVVIEYHGLGKVWLDGVELFTWERGSKR